MKVSRVKWPICVIKMANVFARADRGRDFSAWISYGNTYHL